MKQRHRLSELDNTLNELHNLFQSKPVVISLVLNVTKQDKELVRTFELLDVFVAGQNEDFKRPEYIS